MQSRRPLFARNIAHSAPHATTTGEEARWTGSRTDPRKTMTSQIDYCALLPRDAKTRTNDQQRMNIRGGVRQGAAERQVCGTAPAPRAPLRPLYACVARPSVHWSQKMAASAVCRAASAGTRVLVRSRRSVRCQRERRAMGSGSLERRQGAGC